MENGRLLQIDGGTLGTGAGLEPPTDRSPSRLVRYLPQVIVATTLVAVCPVALVWTLRADGIIGSGLVAVLLGMGLSVAASVLGGVAWKSRSGAGDLLFSELMLWGWVRRWRIERRLVNARRLLEGVGAGVGLDADARGRTLERLASALEAGDPYTHGHSHRVARHATAIARRMGLSPEEVAKIRTAAVLHDVGKIQTPTAILHKPARLSDDEFAVIRRHPGDGAEMVASLGDPELTAMVRHHHERIDGTGYPDHMAGDLIPLGARIIAVADTFDAITSTRPYRPANPHKKAMDILSSESGTQLDPLAVHAFRDHYQGRRALGLWLALTKIPESVGAWLSGGVNAAASTGQVIAATAASGALASAAVTGSLNHPVVRHARPAASHVRVVPAATRQGGTAEGGPSQPPVQAVAATPSRGALHRGGAAGRQRTHGRFPGGGGGVSGTSTGKRARTRAAVTQISPAGAATASTPPTSAVSPPHATKAPKPRHSDSTAPPHPGSKPTATPAPQTDKHHHSPAPQKTGHPHPSDHSHAGGHPRNPQDASGSATSGSAGGGSGKSGSAKSDAGKTGGPPPSHEGSGGDGPSGSAGGQPPSSSSTPSPPAGPSHASGRGSTLDSGSSSAAGHGTHASN